MGQDIGGKHNLTKIYGNSKNRKGMAALKKIKYFIKNAGGDAAVEAAILFPVMIMIFAGLALLAMYLPVRASLQRATQRAATVIATEKSDTWLSYNENDMQYEWETDQEYIYVSFFKSLLSGEDRDKASEITKKTEAGGIVHPPGNLAVSFGVTNYVIYKEVVVTATRAIPMPVNLSLVGFPAVIEITVTSTAVVQNGDEFIRNVDIITDALKYFNINPGKIGDLFEKVNIFK